MNRVRRARHRRAGGRGLHLGRCRWSWLLIAATFTTASAGVVLGAGPVAAQDEGGDQTDGETAVVGEPPTVPDAEVVPGQSVRVNFGLDREPLTRSTSISFEVVDGGALREATVELLGDLRSTRAGAPAFPASQVTTAASVSGDTVRVTVVVEPAEPERVADGVYNGTIRIGGDGLVSTDLPITISLASKGDGPLRWAALALLFGALTGATIRWLNDAGVQLGRLERRWQRHLSILPDANVDLPQELATARREARLALDLRDEQAAEAAIERAEALAPSASLAPRLAELRRIIELQEELIAGSPMELTLGRLISASRLERDFILRRQITDPEGMEQRSLDSIVRLTRAFDVIRASVSFQQGHIRPADEQEAERIHEGLRLARRLITTNKWEQAADVLEELGLPDNQPVDKAPARFAIDQSTWSIRDLSLARIRVFLFLHIRGVVGLATAILIMIIGLDQRFFGAASFTNEFRSYFGLFIWAAGIQLVGIEVAQLASRLSIPRPSARAALPPTRRDPS